MNSDMQRIETDQNGVTDEEYRGVVADQVPVAFLRVELDGKTSRVSGGVGGTALTSCQNNIHTLLQK